MGDGVIKIFQGERLEMRQENTMSSEVREALLTCMLNYCQRGTERQQVLILINQASDMTNPSQALASFYTLKNLVKYEYQVKLSIEVKIYADCMCQYGLYVDNVQLGQSATLSIDSDMFAECVLDALAHNQLRMIGAEEDNKLLQGLYRACKQLNYPTDSLYHLVRTFTLLNTTMDLSQIHSNIADKSRLIAACYPDLYCEIDLNNPMTCYEVSISDSLGGPRYRIYENTLSTQHVYRDPCALENILVSKIVLKASSNLVSCKDSLSLQALIEGNIQCMVDDKQAQINLANILENSNYCSANFIGIKAHENSDKMLVLFKDGLTLELSNRGATKCELRGDILKERLSQMNYNTLYDIVSYGPKTEYDSLFVYALAPVRATLEEIGDEILLDRVKVALAAIEVGNTTYGKLWNIALMSKEGLIHFFAA